MCKVVVPTAARMSSRLNWMKKAAAQNHPPALRYLSELYRHGFASVLDKSQEEANKLLLKSANLGYASANSQLARLYFIGHYGFEKDHERPSSEPLSLILSMPQMS